jgi:hypothetical protein
MTEPRVVQIITAYRFSDGTWDATDHDSRGPVETREKGRLTRSDAAGAQTFVREAIDREDASE